MSTLQEQIEEILRCWHEVESAPRWTCPECQFESSKHDESHERACSKYAFPAEATP